MMEYTVIMPITLRGSGSKVSTELQHLADSHYVEHLQKCARQLHTIYRGFAGLWHNDLVRYITFTGSTYGSRISIIFHVKTYDYLAPEDINSVLVDLLQDVERGWLSQYAVTDDEIHIKPVCARHCIQVRDPVLVPYFEE